jgi:glycerophosphoryl diester phosphodiesterase
LKPLVLGHRGASGYRPENTIEAFELAISQGADGVECDLVPTKDGELIIRHENWLNGTTNIQSIPNLDARKRSGYSDGLTEIGFFSEDFELSELADVRAIERLPDIRPGSAKFDGQFKVPIIDDLLEQSFMDGKTLVIEIKHGMHFTKAGIDVASILARKLDSCDWASRGIKLVIESFDFEMLRLLKQELGPDKKYVFLTELERLPGGHDLIPSEYLSEIKEEFQGISFDLPLLFDLDDSGTHTIPNGTIERARAIGLEIYAWTLKAEDATNSVDEYFAKVALANLEGLFVDQPDLLRSIVDGTA